MLCDRSQAVTRSKTHPGPRNLCSLQASGGRILSKREWGVRHSSAPWREWDVRTCRLLALSVERARSRRIVVTARVGLMRIRLAGVVDHGGWMWRRVSFVLLVLRAYACTLFEQVCELARLTSTLQDGSLPMLLNLLFLKILLLVSRLVLSNSVRAFTHCTIQ